MTQNAQEEETACLTHPVIKQGRQDRARVGCTNKRDPPRDEGGKRPTFSAALAQLGTPSMSTCHGLTALRQHILTSMSLVRQSS